MTRSRCVSTNTKYQPFYLEDYKTLTFRGDRQTDNGRQYTSELSIRDSKIWQSETKLIEKKMFFEGNTKALIYISILLFKCRQDRHRYSHSQQLNLIL